MSGQYSVEALLKKPDFAGERRYLMMESERARREREKLRGRPGWLPGVPGLGVFAKSDWNGYVDKLAKYEEELERHEEEIDEGLIPFQILVTNHSHHDDKSVWVHLTVEGGRIDTHKKAPDRPERLDQVPESKFHFPKITGFVRYGVHVKPHTMEAVFSMLGAEESEYLIHDVLYLELRPETRIKYAVRSSRVKSLHGEIEL